MTHLNYPSLGGGGGGGGGEGGIKRKTKEVAPTPHIKDLTSRT